MVRLDAIPRWSGLNHFDSLASTSQFADGTKLEDLSKVSQLTTSCVIGLKRGFQVIIFACIDVFTDSRTPEAGFVLLKLIHSYLELDMFASLTRQTEHTIAQGEAELKLFYRLLKVSYVIPAILHVFY